MVYLKTLILIVYVALFIPYTFASTTDGTIDASSQYAWSENTGWILFGTTQGNVHVTDDELSGYVWTENVGWISLNCENDDSCAVVDHKVENSDGNLSGYAYGENIGWIDFDPTGSGVVIDSSGVFSGYAWSETIGWIDFNGDNSPVTDWRPESIRNAGSGGSGGGSSNGNRNIVHPTVVPLTSTTTVESTITESLTIEQPLVKPLSVTFVTLPVESSSAVILPQATSSEVGSRNINIINSVDATPEAEDNEKVIEGYSSEIDTEEYINADFSVMSYIKELVDRGRNVIDNSSLLVTATFIFIISLLVQLRYIFNQPISWNEIIYIPSRIYNLIAIPTNLKKRLVPWGTVYDSVTKQPIDPAYIIVRDGNGNEIKDAITDLDGRYGFLLPAGTYSIEATKTHYSFPSKKLAGVSKDILYDDLYFGGEFTISESDPIVKKDIPLDPVAFDWNEFQKGQKGLMSFYSKTELFFVKCSSLLFKIGFIFSFVALLMSASLYNFVVFLLYIALYIIKLLSRDPAAFGSIISAKNELASFAILRVFTNGIANELTHKVADKFGRYHCLVPKGDYSVVIEKKNLDESYSKAYESSVMHVNKGIINKKFKLFI